VKKKIISAVLSILMLGTSTFFADEINFQTKSRTNAKQTVVKKNSNKKLWWLALSAFATIVGGGLLIHYFGSKKENEAENNNDDSKKDDSVVLWSNLEKPMNVTFKDDWLNEKMFKISKTTTEKELKTFLFSMCSYRNVFLLLENNDKRKNNKFLTKTNFIDELNNSSKKIIEIKEVDDDDTTNLIASDIWNLKNFYQFK
jgi:hypothetical protein